MFPIDIVRLLGLKEREEVVEVPPLLLIVTVNVAQSVVAVASHTVIVAEPAEAVLGKVIVDPLMLTWIAAGLVFPEAK